MVLSLIVFIQFAGIAPSKSDIATAQEPSTSPLPQHPQIQVAFNYNRASSYTDSYKQVNRPGDNLEKIVLEQIASAKQSIDLAVEEISLPTIAQALVEKHKAGVKVRWITEDDYVEPWGSITLEQSLDLSEGDQEIWAEFDGLIDADNDGELSEEEVAEREIYTLFNNNGVPWIDDTADGSKGSGLMHHKFMVVDNQKVVTGSANYTLSGMHGDLDIPDSFGNAEHLVVIDSPELAALYTQEFGIMWGDGPGGLSNSIFGVKKSNRPAQTVQVGDVQIQVHFSPSGAKVPYDQTSGGLIAANLNQAQKSVDFAQFVFSDQELANILGRLRTEKGIEVRGVSDPNFAYQRYSSTLDMWGLKLADKLCKLYPEIYPWAKPATQVGVPVLGSTDKLHHKFAVIDGQTVITGSQNWSNAGNRENDENVLVIQSPVVAAHFEREIERLLAGATFGPDASLLKQAENTAKQCGELPIPALPSTAPQQIKS